MASFIEVGNLTKTFQERIAVDHMSFEINRGEIFGFLGPNGAGKTTIINILSTSIPPDKGEISINEIDLSSHPFEIKKIIGMIPQEIALYPDLSAYDNLKFFGHMNGMSGEGLHSAINDVLKVVGLEERTKEAMKTFSGGMMRRLNIAVGIIHRPKLLFMDEPTVGVDPQSRNYIFETVLKFKQEGMTILYTTHYMEEAERLCDRVAIVDNGKITAEGTPKELMGIIEDKEVIVIELKEMVSNLEEDLSKLGNVISVKIIEKSLHLQVKEAQKELVEIISYLNKRNIKPVSIDIIEPNLEMVFLHLTGKKLRDEGE